MSVQVSLHMSVHKDGSIHNANTTTSMKKDATVFDLSKKAYVFADRLFKVKENQIEFFLLETLDLKSGFWKNATSDEHSTFVVAANCHYRATIYLKVVFTIHLPRSFQEDVLSETEEIIEEPQLSETERSATPITQTSDSFKLPTFTPHSTSQVKAGEILTSVSTPIAPKKIKTPMKRDYPVRSTAIRRRRDSQLSNNSRSSSLSSTHDALDPAESAILDEAINKEISELVENGSDEVTLVMDSYNMSSRKRKRSKGIL